MNTQTIGAQRPKLHLPQALLADRSSKRSPTLSGIELRRIVAELLG